MAVPVDADVAFSLLAEDEPIARKIEATLPDGLRSFLYSTKERELAEAQDLQNAFPVVFRTAKICVVLHRAGWGETPWTRLEARTLADRYRDDGSDFLTLVKLDAHPPPPWMPTSDFWFTYDGGDVGAIATYVTSRIDRANRPLKMLRATARTWARSAVPISRYQRNKRYIVEQTTPWRLTECDGCGAAVRFRPILRVVLMAGDHYPASEEHLCAPCARLREISVSVPRTMNPDTVFASVNPSLGAHLRAGLHYDGIKEYLQQDRALEGAGIQLLEATVGALSVAVHLSTNDGQRHVVSVPLAKLERMQFENPRAFASMLCEEILAESNRWPGPGDSASPEREPGSS